MLLYVNELVAPRRHPARLLRFEPRHRRPLHKRRTFKEQIYNLFANSCVHGLHRVFNFGQHLWENYFWAIIVIIASIGLCTMYTMFWHRHNQKQLITVVTTTQMSVYEIFFPAVALCPYNHVNWLRVNTAADRFLPPNANDSVRAAFHNLVMRMEDLRFQNFKPIAAINKDDVALLDNLSLKDVSHFLAYRCDEIFVRDSCVFDETPYDCCQLFIPETTPVGLCLVFNSMMSDNSRKKRIVSSHYPFRLDTAGEKSGLEFTLNHNDSFLRKGSNVPPAFNLIVKKPTQFYESSTYRVYPNTENFFVVQPSYHETLLNTRHIKPSSRKCYFPFEKPSNFPPNLDFLFINCVGVCVNRMVMQYCNCTLPQYLPIMDTNKYPECKLSQYECLNLHADIFGYYKLPGQDNFIKDTRRGYFCQCERSCNSVTYKVELRVRQLPIHPNGTKIIKVDVHYGQRVFTKYETKMKYTYLDLLSSFGGVLGLFLGASLLSFAELAIVIIKLLRESLKIIKLKQKKPQINL